MTTSSHCKEPSLPQSLAAEEPTKSQGSVPGCQPQYTRILPGPGFIQLAHPVSFLNTSLSSKPEPSTSPVWHSNTFLSYR